ncbi:sulfur carrier protein ThiS [Sulfurospirillum barnesii]|uniref:Thiamine biosynthesis protein ThiS n=1 Tax=Sulfurospirillum barnesii (strain ATCC 700032 / DSM 10660 / SES-3) TaxID=760154 RepID=I3XY10_SULBS|nr:sulfur carrier protein ThiS [Sulfurospirillum barnesii]AFL68834.1 thiamine biosynthesis protein ThiS [Sulfurospirillum barnesii SES-3]
MLLINSEPMNAFIGRSVLEFLSWRGLSDAFIAVEINRQIIPKESFSTTLFNDDDTVEIICFVRGG